MSSQRNGGKGSETLESTVGSSPHQADQSSNHLSLEAQPMDLHTKEDHDEAQDNTEDTSGHLRGWRFITIVILTSIIFFVVIVETSIVTTALVHITADIGGFERASWVLSAYLLGFVSLVVVISKLSDILGRKSVYIACILMFTVFSGACAAAQSMTQLIVFRALQGVGGGGSYSMAGIMIIQMVPAKDYAKMSSYTGLAFILAMVLGPITGGGISQHTTWRWIFLFNVPIGIVSIFLAILAIPNGYPNHSYNSKLSPTPVKLSQLWSRVDYLGSILLLLATVAFTSAFQEVNVEFTWDSAYFIVLIILSVVLTVALLFWERRIASAHTLQEAVLPWRFIIRHEMVGALLGVCLVGGPLGVVALQLPQRFQLVNGLGPIAAGLRLLPFGAASSIGGIINAQIMDKFKLPLVYPIIFGSLLQTLGFALLGTSSTTAHSIPHVFYGFEVVAGLGCGFTYIAFFSAIQYAADKYDQAVGLGMTNQFRAMGSAVTVAITTSVFNGRVKSGLGQLGIPDSGRLLDSANGLRTASPELLGRIRHVLADGYNLEMLILCGFGAGQILAAALMWKKKQIRPA